jgi:hypothetical protein
MDQTDSTDLLIVAAPSRRPSERRTDGQPTDVTRSFMAELARAMQAAAQRERKRIARIVADEAAGQAEATRTRAASEAHELQRLAEADVERIEAWAAAEVERIRTEAERRTAERRSDLQTYLARHETIIATELEGLESAVGEFEATLARFFDELGTMADAADIVRRAGSLPAMPDLDDARATARARAIQAVENPPADEPGRDVAADHEDADTAHLDGDGAGVGVMDPDAIGRTDGPAADGAAIEPSEPATDAPGPTVGDPLDVQADVDDEAAQVGAGAAMPASAAARVLRTIIPWTSSNAGHDRGAPPH